MALTKAQILSADDSKLIEVEVPEWGGEVCLRVMSGTERDKFESEFVGDNKSVEMVRAKLVSKCLCDEDGKRIFSEEEIPELGDKSAAVLEMLFHKCMKHNRFTKDDVDDLAGNS
jgi:hypothetical protein